jgi:hypothetical protein
MSRRVLVIGTVATALIAGCGGDDDEKQTEASKGTTTQETTAEDGTRLAGRALKAGELKGFEPTGRDTGEDDARSWLDLNQDTTVEPDEYAKRGFVAGFKRDLVSTKDPDIPGLSVVVQFETAAQAAAEVTRYSKSTPEFPTKPFPVPGIQGAKGFTASGTTTGDNVAFSKGAYFYEIGRVRPPDLSAKQSGATVIAAARTLRARVPS